MCVQLYHFSHHYIITWWNNKSVYFDKQHKYLMKSFGYSTVWNVASVNKSGLFSTDSAASTLRKYTQNHHRHCWHCHNRTLVSYIRSYNNSPRKCLQLATVGMEAVCNDAYTLNFLFHWNQQCVRLCQHYVFLSQKYDAVSCWVRRLHVLGTVLPFQDAWCPLSYYYVVKMKLCIHQSVNNNTFRQSSFKHESCQ